MSNPTGVENVKRRTWNVDVYKAKANERLEKQISQAPSKDDYKIADPSLPRVPGSERAFLQPRKEDIDFTKDIGKKQAISAQDLANAGGYYCDVCECLVKDSMSWLDHVNDQRKLGFSMRVQQSTVEQVRNKLKMYKEKEKELKEKDVKVDFKRIVKYEEKMKEKEEEAKRRKIEMKEKKKEEKLKKMKEEEEEKENEDIKNEEIDEETKKMMEEMGINSFGGSNKNI